jgi:hypothetical protein
VTVDYPGMKATIRDISSEGAYIYDKRPLGIGRIVEFYIQLPESPVNVRGIVRRSEPETGMAVEFIEMSNVGRRQLVQWLSALGKPEP